MGIYADYIKDACENLEELFGECTAGPLMHSEPGVIDIILKGLNQPFQARVIFYLNGMVALSVMTSDGSTVALTLFSAQELRPFAHTYVEFDGTTDQPKKCSNYPSITVLDPEAFDDGTEDDPVTEDTEFVERIVDIIYDARQYLKR